MRLAVHFRQASALFEEYKVCACTQEKNARYQKNFVWGNGTVGRARCRVSPLPALPECTHRPLDLLGGCFQTRETHARPCYTQ
jgi:hypothetical protein